IARSLRETEKTRLTHATASFIQAAGLLHAARSQPFPASRPRSTPSNPLNDAQPRHSIASINSHTTIVPNRIAPDPFLHGAVYPHQLFSNLTKSFTELGSNFDGTPLSLVAGVY
ncbi:MAG: hypothetical protein K8T89_07380, partial [Planctomycetes bacterium]|nr:hypothetical protein [Planctomycetota bacterium]